MAAPASKVATDSHGNECLSSQNTVPDKDDDDDIDLGATALPPINTKATKHDFEMINLDADEENEDDVEGSQPDKRRKRYRKKKKKREQLSDSSSDDESRKLNSRIEDVNPSDLTWPLFLWHYIVAVSSGALRGAEYLGEKLAYFFGITSPKYQYVIDEYYRQKELEQEEEDRDQREKEYVARREAETIASLEGGEGQSVTLTLPNNVIIDAPPMAKTLP